MLLLWGNTTDFSQSRTVYWSIQAELSIHKSQPSALLQVYWQSSRFHVAAVDVYSLTVTTGTALSRPGTRPGCMTAKEGATAQPTVHQEGVCAQLKQVYERCFDAWLKNDLLKGVMEDKCREQLLEYRACLKEHFASMGEKEIVSAIEQYERR
ncbi:hypothetical protein, conserved [Babesia bigemina]|uniref:Uncharacterized protein n=1 Tax=Babesia bigemina TaxID=5866 RepID=A0A061CZ79_BABBI|nr:hypothetical protein, conserved [Babesia bigemina]CDR93931.1 hypothetical protein, conserved [Babesia bigemina]|eukprot:XP_012766117.1 hypothetical protein, conserved [Babesia bigemina]